MGKKKREHREAVEEGREPPFRNEKVTPLRKLWKLTLPHWEKGK
ncbi:hypothetical protein LCGC14_1314100 [marine sediment metagenome]|uniref:Uncharacterized protein n=1 Tax=marine sediment metagenome TaxID=412755 RepID=A0A0F9N2G8_9ZZZZ